MRYEILIIFFLKIKKQFIIIINMSNAAPVTSTLDTW